MPRQRQTPSLEWLAPRLTLARISTLLAAAGLVSLIIVWNLQYADLHGANPWIILGVQLFPLLLVSPGILTGSPRGHVWTCFLINIYFIQGVQAAMLPERRLFGLLEVGLSVWMFVSAMLYARWSAQHARRSASDHLRQLAGRG